MCIYFIHINIHICTYTYICIYHTEREDEGYVKVKAVLATVVLAPPAHCVAPV